MGAAPRTPRAAARAGAAATARRPTAAAWCLLATGLLAGCSADASGGELGELGELAAEELRWDGSLATGVVLIVTDTTRRDRIGLYGGGARTPAFDAFARESLWFDAAYSPSPWTKPSVATLFTSLYPSQHGCVSHPVLRPGTDRSMDWQTDVLSSELTTLAERLQREGFRTAAFVGNPWLRRELGFAQGFELYDDSLAGWDVPGEVVSRKGLEWLAGVRPGERFFLYLHYMDAHRPYGRVRRAELAAREADLQAASGSLAPAAAQAIGQLVVLDDGATAAEAGVPPSIALLEMAYDGGVESFDRALGLFLESFRGHEAFARTALVVTADHGEALFERGWGNHGGALYENEIAIPLAARLPGVTPRGARVASPVGLADLLPTLCACAGLELPAGAPVFGRSWLAPAAEGGRLGERYLVSEGVMNLPGHRAVRHGAHKALWQPAAPPYDPVPRALFRIGEDPGESHDLLGRPESAGDAEAIYAELLRGGAAAVPAIPAPPPGRAPLDPAVLERLRSLGYVK